jgi:hypothetical protein
MPTETLAVSLPLPLPLALVAPRDASHSPPTTPAGNPSSHRLPGSQHTDLSDPQDLRGCYSPVRMAVICHQYGTVKTSPCQGQAEWPTPLTLRPGPRHTFSLVASLVALWHEFNTSWTAAPPADAHTLPLWPIY